MYQEFYIIFGIMAIGFFCRKKGILNENSLPGICSLTIYIALPFLLTYSIGTLKLTDKVFFEFFFMVGLSGLVLILTMAAAYCYYKFRRTSAEYRGISEFAAFMNNNGFIGFALSLAFFGQKGLLYMVATNVTIGVAIWTYGVYLMQRGKTEIVNLGLLLKALMKLLLNPNILATVIGLFLCVYRIELPGALARILSSLGNLATPMAMLYIGASLASCNLMELLKNKNVIEASVFRLVLSPAVTVAGVYFLPVDPLMKAICALEMILPVGATLPMIADEFGSGGKYASQIVFLSTLMSILTMPLWLMFIMKEW